MNHLTITTSFNGMFNPFESELCEKVIDFFMEYDTLYFTPMTVHKSLRLKIHPQTMKNVMSCLLKNQYLTKEDGMGTNHYSITKENKEFYVFDFKNYLLQKQELINLKKRQPENLPIQTSEDDE